MADTTTSDKTQCLESPQTDSKPSSPKAPQRKHKAKSENSTETQDNGATTTNTNEECLTRLAPVPEMASDEELAEKSEENVAQKSEVDVVQKSDVDENDKKVAKTKSESVKIKPESPRTRLKICERDQKSKVIEQLQQENTILKKSLESERSALREHKAHYESESRRERAEARRREASLESQLRTALKGIAPAVPSGPTHDNALEAALEVTKAANKCLQQKLQVLTEADKRKVGELRAQHDAHVLQLQQLERQARTQTAQLLEELKAKERQLNQSAGRSPARGARATQNANRGSVKMGVAEQLHVMEGQISRLESELQRRDDIIQSLRNTKSKKEKQLISRQLSKDCILKDTISDVDSAVSSGPNSLSPQPSPDLWYQSQESSMGNVEDNLLEIAKRQVQELEMSLSISKAGHQNAQLRATQLEEQLQDLREHADLLEFRCLELEDTSEKRNSLGEMTDCDSGCTSPEVCLKNPVSPHLRRSDSGYKSPTHRPPSPKLKNHRILRTPTLSMSDSYSSQIDNNNSTNDPDIFNADRLDCNHHSSDIKDRLERIMLNTHSEEDRSCLEQVLHLLWNLQTLSSSFAEEDFATTKNRKSYDVDYTKCDYEQNKVSKIIATISPYSQKAIQDHTLLSKSISQNDANQIKSESKKLLLGLHESGIFEESDLDNKETQTEWCDFVTTEPEGELATEVQRLNQIREELEKSGAIRNKKFGITRSRSNEQFYEYIQTEKLQPINKRHLEYYENRIAVLENKIAIYESTGDVREKKLAQRLQREINLQAQLKVLEDDLDSLRDKYALLEDERCELEEAENDTRLHCQVLQTEFEIQSAKLRDIDEERSCARNEADCYRALVEEYENKSTYLQEQEKELKEKIKVMESAVPALVFWNIWKIVDKYPDFDFKAACKAKFDTLSSGQDCSEVLQPEILAMIDYLNSQNEDTNPLFHIEDQLHSTTTGDKDDIREKCKMQEDILRSKMVAMEKIVLENSVLCKKQEEAAAMKIKALEEELQYLKDNPSNSLHDNPSRINNLNCDEKCKSKLQALADKQTEYKERIKALENREVMLLMTLTQADEMWAGVENKYKQQIKQLEDNEVIFKEQANEAEGEKNKWRGKCEPLEQKVNELEESETKLESNQKRLLIENRELLSKCESLEDQISSLKIDLQQSKDQTKNVENKFKNELLAQKRKVGVVQEELQVQKKQQLDGDEAHNSKLSTLKKQLSKSAKDLQELEVTNAELKEEVETLEKEVQKLSSELTKRHDENEENIKQLLKELSSKSREAEHLQKELIGYQKLPSAREELEQICKNALDSPIVSPSEMKSFNADIIISPNSNTVHQVITQIQHGANKKSNSHNEIPSDSSVAKPASEVCREKPALPKRKPKLNLDIAKIKKDEQKSKPSEERSGLWKMWKKYSKSPSRLIK
ncbi:uncharacterized protein LOC143911806 isoform X2 [Arctopsyche grandis]|uniref:uncharacterized protein LOC143911806 isoform X2 n=1 Tax=Arctopsyche grandis TaxID=121162 RepID=UPI00406D8FFA